MLPNSQPLFSLTGLRAIFDRWKRLLALATGLAALISLLIVLRMSNMYSSTAVFLPTSLQSADPDRLVEGSKLEVGVRAEDLDRVVTIGQSLPIAELMIRRFKLYDHYQLGSPQSSGQADANTLAEFTSNFTIVHNERDAIELTFRDRDKKLAAQIANAMVSAIDSVNQQLTYENRRQVLELYRHRSQQLGVDYSEIHRLLLGARRRYGIFNLEQQNRYLAKALIDTEKELRIAEGGGPGNATALRRALRGLTKADGGNVINLENYVVGTDSVNLLTARLNDLQTRYVGSQAAYEQAATSLRTRVSSLYLVQKAYPATRKSGPFRTLIVLGSIITTLILCSVLILLLELYRRRGQWLL